MIAVTKLAERLFRRRHETVPLKPGRVRDSNWQPEPRQCHLNVEIWCDRQPKYTVVRGWLVADYSDEGVYNFMPHSVIEDNKGNLIDITPTPMPCPYPFLRHTEEDGDFEEFRQMMSVVYCL